MPISSDMIAVGALIFVLGITIAEIHIWRRTRQRHLLYIIGYNIVNAISMTLSAMAQGTWLHTAALYLSYANLAAFIVYIIIVLLRYWIQNRKEHEAWKARQAEIEAELQESLNSFTRAQLALMHDDLLKLGISPTYLRLIRDIEDESMALHCKVVDSNIIEEPPAND